jgi:hypothetical protein
VNTGSTEATIDSFTDPNGWLFNLVEGLRDRKFYGRVIIEMKEGKIYLIRKDETIKPPS